MVGGNEELGVSSFALTFPSWEIVLIRSPEPA